MVIVGYWSLRLQRKSSSEWWEGSVGGWIGVEEVKELWNWGMNKLAMGSSKMGKDTGFKSGEEGEKDGLFCRRRGECGWEAHGMTLIGHWIWHGLDIDWTKDRTFLSFDRNGDFYRREEELGNGSSFAPDPLDGPGFVSTLSLLHKLFLLAKNQD